MKKVHLVNLFTGLILFVISLNFPQFSAEAASPQPYRVDQVSNSSIVVTGSLGQHVVDYGFGCSISDFREGQYIYIDSSLGPSTLGHITVDGFLGQAKTCSVISSEDVNLFRFFVESVIDTDNHVFVKSSNGTRYVIEYGSGCTSMLRTKSKYIDISVRGVYLEGVGDKIYLFENDNECTVLDADELNLQRFYIESVIDSKDNIIVKSSSGIRYLVEYGTGCNSMWRNESKYIDIDIGADYLDGISDRIYLFDDNDECKVLDADEIGGSSVTCTQYGPYSYALGSSCYCLPGYAWNIAQTSCVVATSCPQNSTDSNGTCVCGEGYLMKNSQCITYTADCLQSFGSNVFGTKGTSTNSSICHCNAGYQWNSSQTACLVTPQITLQPSIHDFSPQMEQTSVSSINQDKGISIAAADAKCQSGTLIKASNPAVYYCGGDGKRYVFTSENIFKTWYSDFSAVIVMNDQNLASIQIGGNVTYRPGTKMVKITSSPQVYAVCKGGVLRAIPSEQVAIDLYGTTWNRQIDDVSEAFFVNYRVGDPIK